MGRNALANYEEAGLQVLEELGGGPISSKDLVAAAQERGLLPEGKFTYHNFLRRVRLSEKFDTSQRGYISLTTGGTLAVPTAPSVEVPAVDAVETEVATETESQ
jgi:hypothetical protein